VELVLSEEPSESVVEPGLLLLLPLQWLLACSISVELPSVEEPRLLRRRALESSERGSLVLKWLCLGVRLSVEWVAVSLLLRLLHNLLSPEEPVGLV